MGEEIFVHFPQAIVNAMENRASTVLRKDKARCDHKDDEPSCQGRTASAGNEPVVVQADVPGVDEATTHQGKLILDATVAEQAIRFPTDLSVLNEGREITARTSEAWINSIFLVMNLMVLLKVFICFCTCNSYKYRQSILGCCLNIFQCLKERSGYSNNVC